MSNLFIANNFSFFFLNVYLVITSRELSTNENRRRGMALIAFLGFSLTPTPPDRRWLVKQPTSVSLQTVLLNLRSMGN